MAYRPQSTKERIAHRLKIAQGHLKKVAAMVEQDVYCIDIIHQSQAVQKALKEVDAVILENHLHCCVTKALQNNQHETAIQELLEIFKKK
jgi:DNA-binding FrmR family transcriptional regulator